VWVKVARYLLPNKKGETYHKLFTILIDLNPRLLPDLISIDFEIATISAIKKAFPQLTILYIVIMF